MAKNQAVFFISLSASHSKGRRSHYLYDRSFASPWMPAPIFMGGVNKTMARARLLCRETGCPEPATYRGRCQKHARLAQREDRKHIPTKIAERRYSEQRKRARTVAAWRKRYGDWCPGYGREPHRATDLTAQHSQALVLGGNVDQQLTVLCRECNSRHAHGVTHGTQRC